MRNLAHLVILNLFQDPSRRQELSMQDEKWMLEAELCLHNQVQHDGEF
jgi:hypothetical protein